MEKKINQDGNKVSSFEIVNEVDEDTVTKENNIVLSLLLHYYQVTFSS